MSAQSHNHSRSVARGVLLGTVSAIVIGLLLSATAIARPTYEGGLVRHAKVNGKKKSKKVRKRRRARAAAVTIDLFAKAGTSTMPDGAVLPIWGFADTAGGAPQAPGPVLSVDKNDPVTLNVTNTLPDDIDIDIPGIQLDAGQTSVAANGGTRTINFTAANPGTYLYESSGGAGRQAEVGLAGALIVRSGTPGQAYDDASTAYTKEAVMVLSEIVPALNNAAANTVDCAPRSCLGSFQMYDYDSDPEGSRFKPTYRLINGKAYPQIPAISAVGGDKVLLRYVNAGSEQATTTMLGIDAKMVGRSGSLLNAPFGFVAQTFPAGLAADAIATVPAGSGRSYPIYDRHLGLVNGTPASSPGGRIRFIEVP